MKFTVTIDDKVWDKCAVRLERAGITGAPHELLEALLTTSLAGVSPGAPSGDQEITPSTALLPPGAPSGDQEITPSTALLLLPGKIKAELELESERDPRAD